MSRHLIRFEIVRKDARFKKQILYRLMPIAKRFGTTYAPNPNAGIKSNEAIKEVHSKNGPHVGVM
jgi:hypothetical protein